MHFSDGGTFVFAAGMFVSTASGGLDVFRFRPAGEKGCVYACVRVCVCVQFQGGVWTLNVLMCDGLMTMDVMLCTASIFNLCAISVDRYSPALLRPLWFLAFDALSRAPAGSSPCPSP